MTDKQATQLNLKRITIWTVCIIVGLWFITLFSLVFFDATIRGTFGDMFGSINALFSGLALAGIIITILLQRQELELQRQELKETKEELKRSATAQENSEIALKRQAENLKISAKLSALSTLLTYYIDVDNKMSEGLAYKMTRTEVKEKIDDYVGRVESILQVKEDF